MLAEPLLGDDALWKRRFRAPRLLLAQIARANPSKGVVSLNKTGKFELYAWDVPSGELTQVTFRSDGTAFGSISPDGRWIYYLDDRDGNQLGHYTRVPVKGGEPVDLTPSLPAYDATGVGLDFEGRFAAIGAPTNRGFELYVVPLGTGSDVREPRLVHSSATLTANAILSADGAIAVWMVAREGKLAFGLVAFDTSTGEQIAELWEDGDASIESVAFSPVLGDQRLAAKSDASGVMRPFIWNAASNAREDVPVGNADGEIAPWAWSPNGDRLILCQVVRAEQRLWSYDFGSERPARIDHPAGTYAPTGVIRSDGSIVVARQDSTRPLSVVALDGETGQELDTLLSVTESIPGRPWRSFTCRSSDGTEVQGWVATPEGDGPFPTIFHTHGGPTAVQMNRYMSDSQMWLDHGFAFASVNYRGSTTFGQAFERGIWGNLGHWEVEDMVAARSWLVDQGIARPDAILLTGWSYGGYLTLHALGLRPDLWAGGMGGVVVADWVSQYEDENDALRGYDVSLFGGALEEMRDQYVKSSPLTYVDRLQAPLLIIQGRNDSTDPPRQVELYEARAKELGKQVEVEWFDTGHMGTLMNQELEIQHEERMLEFAYRVLSSRLVPAAAAPSASVLESQS